jgi:hypothetical protein
MDGIWDPGNIVVDKMSKTGNAWQDIDWWVTGTRQKEINP